MNRKLIKQGSVFTIYILILQSILLPIIMPLSLIPRAQAEEATPSSQLQIDTNAQTSPSAQLNNDTPITPSIPVSLSETKPTGVIPTVKVDKNTVITPPSISSLNDQSNLTGSAKVRPHPFVRKLEKKLFRPNEAVNFSITDVKNSNAKVVVLDDQDQVIALDIRYQENGSSDDISINPPPQFEPGTYTIKVTDWSGQVSEQDFTWGVLAINTNKSIYRPHETAHIYMGVLDDKGGIVCNASLTLEINGPQGNARLSTADNQIRTSEICVKKGYTLLPDYETSFEPPVAGTYIMHLTAETPNGLRSITDSFEVRETVPFDIERSTATRIYPSKPYPVTLSITAERDFTGTVTETTPESFKILPSEEKDVTSYSSVTSVNTSSTSQVLGVSSIGMPFEGSYPISLGFGVASAEADLQHEYEKFGLTGHDGTDFELPMNTPVLAVDDGVVYPVGANGYGQTIVLQHSWGRTYYGHLSSTTLALGAKVQRGEVLGLSGTSGFSTGPHLHFAVLPNNSDTNNGFYGKIDPASVLGIPTDDVLGASTDVYSSKKIVWNVSLKKGETMKLGYMYDAPDISPQFYLLGPLVLEGDDGDTSFQELRQWQIASDAYTGKSLRTIEFALGGSSDNNTRTTGTATYAGSAWGTSKGTDKTVTIPGTGIRVRSAYVDVQATITNAADITNISTTLDVTNGPAAGSDLEIAQEVSVITQDNSGLSAYIRYTADATSLFDRQTDAQFNAGLGVEMGVNLTGPSRRLTSAKLVVTYEQDYLTVSHTEVKTVRFPLDSTAGTDTGTKTTACAAAATCVFGYTADIPDAAADGDILDVFFELSAEIDSATASTITPKITGGSAGTAFNWTEATLNDTNVNIVFRPTVGGSDFLRNTAQSIDVTMGTVPANMLGGELVVTYQYSTGASSQTNTVRYYMDQRTTDPAATKNTFSQSITISNTGFSVKNLWYRVHTAPTDPASIKVYGTVGAAGEASNTYTYTGVNPRGANTPRIIYDMTADKTSFSSATTTVAGAVEFVSGSGSAPGVELFVTFTWSGSGGGAETKTVSFSAAQQGIGTSASEWSNTAAYLALPETVTKTYRSAYVAAHISHSNATNITVGTVTIGVDNTTTAVAEDADTTSEAYNLTLLHSISSTIFSGGGTIGWTDRAFEVQEMLSVADEVTFYNEIIVTYDANFTETGSALTGKSLQTIEFVLGGSSDNNTRTSATTTFAGSAWGTSKGTDKTVTIPGSGIRVRSAYVDMQAILTTNADITDVSMTMDVTNGPAAGTNVRFGEENAVITLDSSGLAGNNIRSIGDATALFDRQSDSQFNAGLGVELGVTITGSSRRLTTAKLVITFEQDVNTASHTEVKTVRFPLDSTAGTDTGTKTTACAAAATCVFAYTADIPDAAANGDILDVFFELHAEVDSATASTITPKITGGSAGTAFNWTEAVANDTNINVVFRPAVGGSDFLRNTAQSLDITMGTVAANVLGGELIVTYQYSTGAASQTNTVKYYMDQRTTDPSTTKNTFSKSITISNTGMSVSNLWYKIHTAPVSAQTFTVYGTVGAAAETSKGFTITGVNPRSSDTPTIYYDMTADKTSFSSATTTVAGATQFSGAGGGPPAVELYVTFKWTGTSAGTQTKSVAFGAGQQGVATTANQPNVKPVYLALPETVTKTYRSAYVNAIVNHSQATSLTIGTATVGIDGTTTGVAETADATSEDYAFEMFHEISSTIFSGGSTIGWYDRVFTLSNDLSVADERYFANIINVTYDAAFPSAVEPAGSYATPAYVQSKLNRQSASQTTNAVTFNSSVTSGNLVVVAITAWNNTNNAAISTVADNKGNNYSLAVQDPVGNGGSGEPVSVYYAENVTGGSSFQVTVTLTNAGLITVAIHEYSGIAASGALDKTAQTTGSSNAPNSGNTATTTQANELIFGATNWNTCCNTPTISVGGGSGFNLRESNNDNNTFKVLATEDKAVSSTGTYNSSFSLTTSEGWRAVVATFKAASVAGETASLSQLMRHGRWFSSIGVKKPFSF